MTRFEALRKWIDACARVAKDDAIVLPLAQSTGLSVENVRIGLERHLETNASDAELDALALAAKPAERVHVILSASVFVAPLRAIALALAASDCVTVRPSRREPLFAEALVRAMDDAHVTLARDARPEDVTRGEIHVYGSNETIALVRAAAKPEVFVRGHGTAMSVALVTADHAFAATKLAEDVTAFDQRGCSSPRVAFVVGDARAFARTLFDALEARGALVPRGALDQNELEDFARWSSTIAYAGVLHRGASCAVGALDARAFPPSGRHILVRALETPGDLPRVLGEDARFVIAVGTDAPIDSVRAFAPSHARVTALGELQRPPLDGPVDRRV
jgi:hypothetical protein